MLHCWRGQASLFDPNRSFCVSHPRRNLVKSIGVCPPFPPTLSSRAGRFFDRNIWPDFRVFRIQRQPFLKPWSGISLNGIDGTFWFANATIDAFVRMDDEHILALVEAIHGAHSDAVHGFAANAGLVDDVGQLSNLSADRSGGLIRDVRPPGTRSSAENGRRGDQCRLARSVHRTADIPESIGAYPSSRRSFRHRDTHSLGTHQSADALHSQL